MAGRHVTWIKAFKVQAPYRLASLHASRWLSVRMCCRDLNVKLLRRQASVAIWNVPSGVGVVERVKSSLLMVTNAPHIQRSARPAAVSRARQTEKIISHSRFRPDRIAECNACVREIMMSKDSWVPRAVTALHEGDANYKLAADIIVAAMEQDQKLSQRAVASHIGRHESWVSCLLKWHRAGCDPRGPFAAEAAKRRENLRRRKFDLTPTPEELGEDPLFTDGTSDHVPGQTEATLMAFGVPSQCRSFNETLSGLTREKLLLAYRTSEPERRREVLMSADRALYRVEAAVLAARTELGAALKQLPPEPMFDDVELAPHPTEVFNTGAGLTLCGRERTAH